MTRGPSATMGRRARSTQSGQFGCDCDIVTFETKRRLTDIAALMAPWAQRLDLGQTAAADEDWM